MSQSQMIGGSLTKARH